MTITTAEIHVCALLHQDPVVAVRTGLNLHYLVEIDQRGSMNPGEQRRIQTLFEPPHGFPQSMRLIGEVQHDVVTGRLDPVNAVDGDLHGPAPGLDQQNLQVVGCCIPWADPGTRQIEGQLIGLLCLALERR